MDYDFRNRVPPPYDPTRAPTHGPRTTQDHPAYVSSSPLRLGQHVQSGFQPHGQRSFHAASAAASSSSFNPAGLGIRVAIKPEYMITAPPRLSHHSEEVSKSNFQFDFDLERKVLSETGKHIQNWSKFAAEILPPKPITEFPPSTEPSPGVSDPVMGKYAIPGMNREAISLVVATYGDNQVKVTEFIKAFNVLLEMGFSSNVIADALVMYDNDTDKALAHFLSNPS